MAKETSSANTALPLHEVLEAEFIALHGRLPVDYPTSAEPTIRLKAIFSAIHGLEEKRAALCLSGGGIRSAVFGLGILEGLAGARLLDKFHYLSTVAGGGFIGSWLVAWIHRSPGGIGNIAAQLAYSRETAPEVWGLRAYANYLNPEMHLFSTETWRLLVIYFRNILAMSFILMPLLAAVVMIPWLHTAIMMKTPTPYTSVPLWIGVASLVLGGAYIGINLPSSGNQRGSKRTFLTFCLMPLVIASFSMTIYWAWFATRGHITNERSFLEIILRDPVVSFICLGMAVHLSSWAASLRRVHGFQLRRFVAAIFSGGVLGCLLWLGATKIFPQPLATPEFYSAFAAPVFLSIVYFDILVSTIITSRWTPQEEVEWWTRAAAWILSIATAWIGLNTLTLFGPALLNRSLIWALSTVTLSGVIGFIVLVAGRLGLVATTENSHGGIGVLVSLLFNKTIAAYLFGIALIIVTVQVLTWQMGLLGHQLQFSTSRSRPAGWWSADYLNVILYAPFWAVALFATGLAVSGIALSYLVNPNQFSLQAIYRDRVVRVFLGASNKRRKPNLFTGFDATDDILMRQLVVGRLIPIINMTLNLSGLGSRSDSFTVSPLHCGSKSIGYRNTEGPNDSHYAASISLGRAMAMSGAANSPNMGYYASPLVRLVFTLLNVRLGEWLGSPGPAGSKTFDLPHPNFSAGPIIADTVGLTSDVTRYVNVSDGRHFEGLGLYEMVLRRCHYIVVSDAGVDPEFSFAGHGDAVRKIWNDFAIPIEFEPMTIYPRSAIDALQRAGHNCAIGRIRYSSVDGDTAPDGIIVYIKPVCYGDEPRDIFSYFRRNEDFPHESTSGRPFTDIQFDVYRMLGVYTMEKLCPDRVGDFSGFVREILTSHLQIEPPKWAEWLAPLIQPSSKATGATGAT